MSPEPWAPRHDGEVCVTMPATPAHIRLARVVAAGVASLGDLPYDAVEDLRIAVDELCTLLVGAAPDDAQLELSYRFEEAQIVVRGSAPAGGASQAPAAPELTRQILGAVTDHYDLWVANGRVGFELVSALWQSAG